MLYVHKCRFKSDNFSKQVQFLPKKLLEHFTDAPYKAGTFIHHMEDYHSTQVY